MSIHLRYADQRLVLMCDRKLCVAHIVADAGSLDEQRQSLTVTAEALRWRCTTDAGDFCPDDGVSEDPLPPVIPREQLCRKTTWCLLAHGHDGKCREVPRGKHAAPDLGPVPGEVGWSMSKRRRS